MNIKQNASAKIIKYKKQLAENGFSCSRIEERQYNFEITAIKNDVKNKLLVYFGKKGIKNVIQGAPSSREYNELNSIISGNLSFSFEEKKELNYSEYIGTDETGKGDYFGPLVVAGMYVNEEISQFLFQLGVRDSKELSDSQIDKMANEIRIKYPLNYSIISLIPEKYNEIYTKFNNLNKLLEWAHSKVIENIFSKFKPPTVIIDQFSKTPFKISDEKEYSSVDFIQIPKAEKYIGVAAASILARNEMSKWFYNMQDNGYSVLRGASAEVENRAKNIYIKNGRSTLTKLVKLHFKTTKKIFED